MRKGLILAVALVAAMGFVVACGGSSSGGGDTPSEEVCGGATMGCVTGIVQDETGAAIATGITVTAQGATAAAQTVAKAATDLATTNGQGWFAGDNLPEGEQVLCYSGAGYVKKCVTVNIRAQENTPLPPVKLPTRGAVIAVVNVNGGAAQAVDPNTSALLDFNQVDSICDASGAPVTGDINCYLTPVDSSATDMDDTAPETFAAITAASAQGTMVSSAMMEATCEKDGTEVNICAGKTVGVRVPLYADNAGCNDAGRNPATLDAWYFDEATGNWQDYGVDFARSACATGKTDQYYEGAIDHFTWVNGDVWRDDVCLTGLVYTAGTTLTGTNLTVQCWGSGWRNTVQVGTDGRFCIPAPSGYNYTCKVGDTSGWIDQVNWVTGTATGTIVPFPLTTCPHANCTEIDAFVFASPILTTTLTWGTDPRDLDSHTFGTGVHIYFVERSGNPLTKGSLTSAPYIALDTDDVTSFGPEVTTVMPGVTDGKYCFGIHLYDGEGAMNQTSPDEFGNDKVATVIVTGDGVAQSFTAPSGTSTDYWRIYTVEFAGGTVVSGSFTSVNDYVSEVPTDCNW